MFLKLVLQTILKLNSICAFSLCCTNSAAPTHKMKGSREKVFYLMISSNITERKRLKYL